ncbi:enolase N-terminal domain-like protein, partial [Fomitopsis betulina]
MSITRIHARQIFDSRGNPTIEIDLFTAKGLFRASVPSGASTGIHEAVELGDGDKAYKVLSNVNNIIAPAFVKSGIQVTSQKEINELLIKLDETPNKSKLG